MSVTNTVTANSFAGSGSSLTGITASQVGLGNVPNVDATLRANHSGSQTASTISDFSTVVQGYRLDQFAQPTAALNFNGQRLTNLGAATSANDAVRKAEFDAMVQGLQQKPTATVATTAALPGYTYANGTAGVGATLTASGNGALSVDGYAVQTGDLVFVKNDGAKNGLYTVTQPGSAGTPYILTRHVDMDTSGEFVGAFIPVENLGTVNANTLWLTSTTGAITVGTTSIAFVQLNGATSISASSPLSFTGNTLSLGLTARLTTTGGNLDLANGIVTPGTYFSVTVDTYGRVTGGADLVGGNGMVVRTTANTYTSRSITGTLSRIGVTNGDGVSANPVIDIAANYVGQTSLTTLGTISTGTWQASPIGLAYGGLGVDASTTAGKLTARGNLNASGIFSAVIGDGSATNFSITQATHGLSASQALMVQIVEIATNQVWLTNVAITTGGTVTVSFAFIPTVGQFRVVIQG